MIGPETPRAGSGREPERKGKDRRRGHGRWMMIACCIPMLAIAIALVATGVVGSGFIIVAVACTLMMAVMMAGMSRGGGSGPGGD